MRGKRKRGKKEQKKERKQKSLTKRKWMTGMKEGKDDRKGEGGQEWAKREKGGRKRGVKGKEQSGKEKGMKEGTDERTKKGKKGKNEVLKTRKVDDGKEERRKRYHRKKGGKQDGIEGRKRGKEIDENIPKTESRRRKKRVVKS